jgi:uncharacterized membrane protein
MLSKPLEAELADIITQIVNANRPPSSQPAVPISQIMTVQEWCANRRVSRSKLLSSISARGVLPLPPAQMLAEYKEILPDLPQRFVDWTETQAAHRRELERMRAEGLENRMNRGQWGALIVAVVGLGISGAVGILGHWVASAVVAVVSVGGPTAAVLLASNSSFGWPRSKKNNSPPPSGSTRKGPGGG